MAESLISASALANITGFMAFAPAGSAGFFRSFLPERIGLLETDAPDFGECLFYAATTLLDAGHDAVCLLNSDSPTLPIAYLIAAATALAAVHGVRPDALPPFWPACGSNLPRRATSRSSRHD